MVLKKEHFEHALRRYSSNPTLQRAVRDGLPEQLDAVDERRVRAIIGAPTEASLVTPEGVLTTLGERVVETIVEPLARPVLVIRDNAITDTFLGPDSEYWRAPLAAAKSVLDRVIPAVGRIEVDNHPGYTWLGTGWLIAPQVVVTNRHVAREFGQRDSQRFVFRSGLGRRAMQSTVDFLEEYERGSALDFQVESILWIASVREPDVAFLRVRPQADRVLPKPIPIAESPSVGTAVATIGYPARDSRVPDQQLVQRIFGDVYEKKRLAPGEVRAIEGDDLLHDCTTLGGNSGSPVIDLATGEAVGLHFSGLYREANYAVAAPRLRALLTALERGELSRAPDVVSAPPVSPPAAAPPQGAPGMNAVLDGDTLRVQIPIEVSVRVGGLAALSRPAAPAAVLPPQEALAAARAQLAGDPDVLTVALGYRFRRGWITDERVIAVTVREKRTPEELRARGRSPLPSEIGGIPIDVRAGSLAEQLEGLGVSLEAFEARISPGAYRPPPHLTLERVDEPMRAVFHVSPDAGFPTLKAFIGRVSRHMTATMYEWEAEHITEAIIERMSAATDRLKLVTDRKGTRAAIAELEERFEGKLEHTWASVGGGKLIPTAYHIKVASRDGQEVWLSSGNWKTSGQPDIDPVASATRSIQPLRRYNREWHAVIANPTLAVLFQKYIEWDFDEAQRVPIDEALELVAGPELFVPERAFAPDLERVEVRYHAPLVIDRRLDVQPLLTPDWRSDGEPIFMANAIEMLEEARDHIYLQNQSFSPLAEGDNLEEFERFMVLLADRQSAGIDVRIIFRDPREFGNDVERLHLLLERCKDLGLDTDRIKVQRACHTKGLMIDGAQVILGSHNLTNTGALYNRDASLRVRDTEVARYFEAIFLYDWDVLAKQDAEELVGGMRLAAPGEATPPGFRRVTLQELVEET